MRILISDGKKLIFAEVSRMETEDGTIRFYGSCNDNLIASISYEQYKEYSAEQEAEFSLLYLVDMLEKNESFGSIRPAYRFGAEKNKIVRIEIPEE